MVQLPTFTLDQLTDLLVGLAGMKQPLPDSDLAQALPLTVQQRITELSSVRHPQSDGRKTVAAPPTTSPPGQPPIPCDALTDSDSQGSSLLPISRTGSQMHSISGTSITAVLTWAANTGATLSSDWLRGYSKFVLRCIRQERQGAGLHGDSDVGTQFQGQGASSLGSGASGLPRLRPKDHCALLEAIASMKRRRILPQPPLDVMTASRETSSGAKDVAVDRNAPLAPAELSRLVSESLIPAAATAARRRLARAPLVARTCVAIADILGVEIDIPAGDILGVEIDIPAGDAVAFRASDLGAPGADSASLHARRGEDRGGSSQCSATDPPPGSRTGLMSRPRHPGRRYVEALEAATRRHMAELSAAELAAVAEALIAWGEVPQPTAAKGSEIPQPLSERRSEAPKPSSSRGGQSVGGTVGGCLSPAWSAAAVIHTMRPGVLLHVPSSRRGLPQDTDPCEGLRRLASLVRSFRGLGCRAPQLWFEAVLEAEAELIRRVTPGGAGEVSQGNVEQAKGASSSKPTRAETSRFSYQPHALRRWLLSVPGAADGMRLLASRRPDLFQGWDWEETLLDSH